MSTRTGIAIIDYPDPPAKPADPVVHPPSPAAIKVLKRCAREAIVRFQSDDYWISLIDEHHPMPQTIISLIERGWAIIMADPRDTRWFMLAPTAKGRGILWAEAERRRIAKMSPQDRRQHELRYVEDKRRRAELEALATRAANAAHV